MDYESVSKKKRLLSGKPTYNTATFNTQPWPMVSLRVFDSQMGVHTLFQLRNKVIRDLLERGRVDGEGLFQLLNLLEQVLGDIGHGA